MVYIQGCMDIIGGTGDDIDSAIACDTVCEATLVVGEAAPVRLDLARDEAA